MFCGEMYAINNFNILYHHRKLQLRVLDLFNFFFDLIFVFSQNWLLYFLAHSTFTLLSYIYSNASDILIKQLQSCFHVRRRLLSVKLPISQQSQSYYYYYYRRLQYLLEVGESFWFYASSELSEIMIIKIQIKTYAFMRF